MVSLTRSQRKLALEWKKIVFVYLLMFTWPCPSYANVAACSLSQNERLPAPEFLSVALETFFHSSSIRTVSLPAKFI